MTTTHVPTFTLETVTPDLARIWLSAAINSGNRSVRRGVVTRYREDMVNGRWHLAGDPIRFDVDGRLIDGQHRLHAVAAAGVPVQFIIGRGFQKEVQAVLDQGATRNAADVLRFNGKTGATTVYASALKIIYAYDEGRIQHAGSLVQAETTKVSHSLMVDLMETYDLDHLTAWAQNTSRRIRLIGAVLLSTRYLQERSAGKEITDEFWDGVFGDTPTLPKDPRRTLREWIQRQDTSGRGAAARGRVASQFHAIATCWVAWRKGQDLTKFQFVKKAPVRDEITGALITPAVYTQMPTF